MSSVVKSVAKIGAKVAGSGLFTKALAATQFSNPYTAVAAGIIGSKFGGGIFDEVTSGGGQAKKQHKMMENRKSTNVENRRTINRDGGVRDIIHGTMFAGHPYVPNRALAVNRGRGGMPVSFNNLQRNINRASHPFFDGKPNHPMKPKGQNIPKTVKRMKVNAALINKNLPGGNN